MMTVFLSLAVVVLTAVALVGAVAAIRCRDITGRIAALQLTSSVSVGVLAVLGVAEGSTSLLLVSLLLALLGAVTLVALVRRTVEERS